MEERIAQLEEENAKLRTDIESLEKASKMLVRRDLDLRAAYDELKAFDKEKSDFVSTAAHQLRTPLTSVHFSYQMLRDTLYDKLDEKQQRVLDVAALSVERMFLLIEDFITTDSLDYGTVAIKCKNTKLELFIRDVIEQVQEQARHEQVQIAFNPAPDTASVCIDAEHMSQALLNLIENAVKYSPNGSTVTVTTSYDSMAAYIKVVDVGIGVPDEDVGKLFRKFYRSDNARKVDANGSGLGLYISKRIIERHNGSVVYQKNEPHGSIFVVTLPFSK